nr:DHH family phosphoesterase [Lachnospiraceae bacterium]
LLYKDSLIAMYLYDETKIMECMQENNDQKTVVGLIYIDNYEEVFESTDEVKRALMAALIEKRINKYMQGVDALVKMLEKDKYMVLFKKKNLASLQANKFTLLDEARSINVGNKMPITLSFGIGLDADSIVGNYEFARAAIDLALGRGGDQVVIKDKEHLVYYGGKSVQVEKSTRVKARVKAHALKEIVEAKDEIIVMGHSISDVDAFGAAVGICRIAKTFGKKSSIVINEVTSTVKPFMDRFLNDNEYDKNMFLKNEQALEIMTPNTLLVVVDVNRKNYTECPELIDIAKNIIVLDHHRQTGDAIENTTLSYVEPYASSACEMIAEVLQYVSDGLKLRPVEADAMYAGIMIDTNNFLTKTGVRTFEAAAYLRRNGADIIRIRKALRTDMEEYRVRAEAIGKVELFLNNFAITECHAEQMKSPTIVGAQVANELLDISGVKASFVLTPFNNKIYISARSIDEVNVQLVMEKFGGGGHMTVAGAQMEGKTIEEVKSMLRVKVAEMVGNEEI